MNISGSPLDYIIAFFAGMLVSFTPCVFSLVPVSAAFIAGHSLGYSRSRGFILSLIYVLGIAITYSFLGIIASLSGKIFGSLSSHPLTHIVVGLVIMMNGLIMLEIIKFNFPSLVRPSGYKKKGMLSVLALGLVSGLVVSPCTTPVLGSILGYLALKKNIVYGSLLLFSFAYGMGFILILVGTFSSLALSWPKSGKWLMVVRNICAGLLLLLGGYFIYVGLRRMS